MKLQKFIPPILLFAFLSVVNAAPTSEWRDEGFEDFMGGELTNIAVHTNGLLRSGPAMTSIVEISEPIIWSAILAPDGSITLGTGNQGRVLRVDVDSGEVTVLFESPEVMVRALAYDSAGRLYVGTSPSGQVFRITDDGRAERIFSAKEDFIWDMVFDHQDNLYVAVGSPARIYQIPVDDGSGVVGSLEPWFSAAEEHITVLAWDPQGRLLAGSAPRGILYRISDPETQEALFQSGNGEIKAIEVEPGGAVLFSMYAAKRSSGGRSDTRSRDDDNESREQSSSQIDGSKRGVSGASAVYRLRADGIVEVVWEPDSGGIFSIASRADGAFFAGSEELGKLYAVRRFDDWEVLRGADDGGSVIGIIANESSDITYLICSGPSRIYRLENEVAQMSIFESRVHDARRITRWGNIQIVAPSGPTGIKVSTRSGNTDEPDATWSQWQVAENRDGLYDTVSPSARFLQYRIDVDESDSEAEFRGFSVRRVRGFHRPLNEPPVVTHLRVFPFGFQMVRTETNQPLTADFDQMLRVADPNRLFDAAPAVRRQLRHSGDAGHFTAIWRAVDPDGDAMRYRVKLKSVDESTWRWLADDIEEAFLTFNVQGLENGYYNLSVTANDSPDNEGAFREGNLLSDVFLIDNAPPVLSLSDQTITGTSATLRITADDVHGMVRSARYQLNGGPATKLDPESGMFDTATAVFLLHIDGLRSGENSLSIEVSDEMNNWAVLNTTLQVE